MEFKTLTEFIERHFKNAGRYPTHDAAADRESPKPMTWAEIGAAIEKGTRGLGKKKP